MPVGEFIVSVTQTKDGITADALLRVLEDSLRILSADGEDLANWQIDRLKMASPLTWRGRNTRAVPSARRLQKALLAVRDGRKPRTWRSDDAARAERIRKFFATGVGMLDIQLVGTGRMRINQEAAEMIAALKVDTPASSPRDELGEWEGTLYRLTVDEKATSFGLRDRIQGRTVDCLFDRAMLLDKVRKLVPHRVRVTGLIRMGNDAFPTSIRAFDVVALPEEVIDYATWEGINITGGIDSVEFVDRGRYGD